MIKCPRCDSPEPRLHPAVQLGGEVQICSDTFHGNAPVAQPADKISEAERACSHIYMSIHVSELSKHKSSIQNAWYIGQRVWGDQNLRNNDD